ncbi:hypothetical protein [Ramlibacter montanisoli]|uniref:hypothetical protein n=1 Tax=Ramlibacter montanisoli TaxID=2732512 RepID=UPI00209C3DBC|nr:hypothetical protein [Ramlibacter montanisoli]
MVTGAFASAAPVAAVPTSWLEAVPGLPGADGSPPAVVALPPPPPPQAASSNATAAQPAASLKDANFMKVLVVMCDPQGMRPLAH